MPAIDDRLREGLERLAEPPYGDGDDHPGALFDRVSERRTHRRTVRRVQSAALVIGVVVGVAVGALFLLRAFQPSAKPARPGPVAADGLIAFARQGGGIFVIRSDGSDPRQLLANARDPAWSPDGRHIAFARVVACDRPRPGSLCDVIMIANADGSGARVLFTTPRQPALGVIEIGANTNAGAPNLTWGRHGFTVDFNGLQYQKPCSNSGCPAIASANVWVTTVDRADPHQLTGCSPTAGCVAFEAGESPASDRTAWVRLDSGGAQIWTTLWSKGPGDHRPAVACTHCWLAQPSWAPDGSQIAFWRGHGTHTDGLFVVGAFGGHVRRIAGCDTGICPTPNAAGTIAWSPDGTRMVVAAGPMWMLNADGSNPTV